MDKNISSKIYNDTFSKYSETVWVYLKASNSQGVNYDPYRNVGATTTEQSPEPVRAIVRQLTGDSLVARELGLVNIGSIELIIKEKDLGLFKICQKVTYNDEEYSVNIKALGNRVQFYKHLFGYYRVVLFKVGN